MERRQGYSRPAVCQLRQKPLPVATESADAAARSPMPSAATMRRRPPSEPERLRVVCAADFHQPVDTRNSLNGESGCCGGNGNSGCPYCFTERLLCGTGYDVPACANQTAEASRSFKPLFGVADYTIRRSLRTGRLPSLYDHRGNASRFTQPRQLRPAIRVLGEPGSSRKFLESRAYCLPVVRLVKIGRPRNL